MFALPGHKCWGGSRPPQTQPKRLRRSGFAACYGHTDGHLWMTKSVFFLFEDTYIRTYVRTYVRTCVRTYIRTYVRTYIRRYVSTYVRGPTSVKRSFVFGSFCSWWIFGFGDVWILNVWGFLDFECLDFWIFRAKVRPRPRHKTLTATAEIQI
jgi:hypothetical protein